MRPLFPLKPASLDARLDVTLPVFIGTAAACVLFAWMGKTAWVMPVVLGVMAGGLVDLDNALTGRLKNIFFTALLFSASTLVVQTTIGRGVIFIAAMTALTFALTFTGAAGLRYRTIAFGALFVACYAALLHMPDEAWFLNTMLIVLGTLFYGLLALALHAALPHRRVQLATANAFDALAMYFDAKADFFDPDEVESLQERSIALAMKNIGVIAAFNECRSALFYRMRGQHRHPRTLRMLRYYFALQDMHERVSSSYADYRQLAARLENTDLIFRINRLMELQAQSCRDMAASLRGGAPYRYSKRLVRATEGCQRSLRLYVAQHAADDWVYTLQRLLDNLLAIDWQLAHLKDAVDFDDRPGRPPLRYRVRAVEREGWQHAWAALRAQCHRHSRVLHHAVRLSLVVSISCALVQALDLQRGYWILLTALVVCQPNYSATKSRVAQRVAGAALGVLVGSMVPWFTPSPNTKLWIITVTNALYFFTRTRKYAWAEMFMTIQAIMALSLAGADVYGAMPVRLLDTAVGAGLAWAAVYWLWPDWKHVNLGSAAAQSAASAGVYLRQIAAQLQSGAADDLAYRAARRTAHENAAALGSILSDMSSEPGRYGARVQMGFSLLKIVYALLGHISALGAYRSGIQEEGGAAFNAALFALARQMADALEHLADFDNDDIDTRLAQLRAELDALHVQARASRQGSILWRQLDMMARQLTPYRALLAQVLDDAAHKKALPQEPQV